MNLTAKNIKILSTLAFLLLHTKECQSSFFLSDEDEDPIATSKKLDLSKQKISDADFLHIAGDPQNASYTDINLSLTNVTGTSFIKLSRYKHLITLKLSATRITIADLKNLSLLSNLTELDLSHCIEFRGDVSKALRENISHLPIVTLALNGLNDQCYLKLEDFLSEPTRSNHFSNLEALSIRNAQLDKCSVCRLPLKLLDAEGVVVIDVGEALVKETITFTKTPTKPKESIEQPFNSQSNVRIAEYIFRNKKAVKIVNEESSVIIKIIDDYMNPQEWFNHIAGQTLTSLNLSKCQLVDDHISAFSQLTSLTTLFLNENLLKRGCLRHIQSLPLQTLELKNNQISEISKRGVMHPTTKEILYEELVHNELTFNQSLTSLSLDKNPINGSSIKSLLKLPKLKFLSLKGIDFIDENTRARIMNLLLGCRIDLKILLSKNLERFDTPVKICVADTGQPSRNIFFIEDEKYM